MAAAPAPNELHPTVPTWLEQSTLPAGSPERAGLIQVVTHLPALFDAHSVTFTSVTVADNRVRGAKKEVSLDQLPLLGRIGACATKDVQGMLKNSADGYVTFRRDPKTRDLTASLFSRTDNTPKANLTETPINFTEIFQYTASHGGRLDKNLHRLPMALLYNVLQTEHENLLKQMNTPTSRLDLSAAKLYANELENVIDGLSAVFEKSGIADLEDSVEITSASVNRAKRERSGGMSILDHTGGQSETGKRLMQLVGQEDFLTAARALMVPGEKPLSFSQIGGMIVHVEPGESMQVLFHAYNKQGSKKGATREIQIQCAGDTELPNSYAFEHKRETGEEPDDNSLVGFLEGTHVVDLDVAKPKGCGHKYEFGVTINQVEQTAQINLFVVVPLQDRSNGKNTVVLLSRYPPGQIAASPSDSLAFPSAGVSPDALMKFPASQ